GERRAQVALHVDGERFERGDVEHAAPLVGRRPPSRAGASASLAEALGGGGQRREHQTVETPKKCGERLAAAGGREDEGRLAARDRRPAELLRAGGRGERAGEP